MNNIEEAFCYHITTTVESLYHRHFGRDTQDRLAPDHPVAIAMKKMHDDIRNNFIGYKFRWNPEGGNRVSMTARQYLEYVMDTIYPWIMAIAIMHEQRLHSKGQVVDLYDNSHIANLLRIPQRMCWLIDEIERRDQQRAIDNAIEMQRLEAYLLDRKIPTRRLGGL